MNSMTTLEKQLLISFNGGDQKAFELIFRSYYERLCCYAFKFPSILFAQTGTVFDNLSMKSEILKMERKYAIYLPTARL